MYTKAQVIALQKDAARAAEKARSAYSSWSTGKTSEVGRMNIISFGNRVGDEVAAKVQSTKVRASKIAPGITDRAKADQVLTLTEQHLANADKLADDVGFLHNFTGLKQSLKDGVASSQHYINVKLRPSLPRSGVLSENDRMRVALVAILAEDTLRRYDEVVKDKELQFWPNFRKALVQIVGEGAGVVKDAAVAAAQAAGWKVIVPVAIAATAVGAIALYAYGRGTGAAKAAIL